MHGEVIRRGYFGPQIGRWSLYKVVLIERADCDFIFNLYTVEYLQGVTWVLNGIQFTHVDVSSLQYR